MLLPVLPKKVYLPEAIAEFGLNEMPFVRAINTMLMYSEHDNLSINFDETVKGTKTSHEPDVQRDHRGEITKLLVAGSCGNITEEKKSIVAANAYQDNGECKINLRRFESNNIEYYTTEETEMFIESISIKPESLYFDREELLSFIYKMDFDRKSIKKHQKNISREAGGYLPAYRDPHSKYYAEEMDLAFQLHTAIWLEGYERQCTKREIKVNTWLSEYAPNSDKITPKKLDRLSTIIRITKKH